VSLLIFGRISSTISHPLSSPPFSHFSSFSSVLGIILNAGGGPLGGGYTGFRYWKSPGPFVQFESADGTVIEGTWGRFVAFWAVLVQASFSFIGTEILAVTGEYYVSRCELSLTRTTEC